MDMELFLKIGSYILTGAVPILLWIWRESGKRSAKESNIHNAIETLKIEIFNNRRYFEEKINHLEKELEEQKNEKRMMEERIYKKVEKVEGMVSKSSEDIGHIKIMLTQIATLQKVELKNL